MKRTMYVGALIATASMLGTVGIAFAQTATGNTAIMAPLPPQQAGGPGDQPQGNGNSQGMPTSGQMPARPMNTNGPKQGKRQAPPIVITIDVNGHILLRGSLISSSGSTLTIKSWGMTFTVDTSKAQIGGNASISSFATGDIIGIQGMLDQNTPGAVTATTVRDWGTSQNTGRGSSTTATGLPDFMGQQPMMDGSDMNGIPFGPQASGSPQMMRPGMNPFGPNASGTPPMPQSPFGGWNMQGTSTQGGPTPQDMQHIMELQGQVQGLLNQLNQYHGQPMQQMMSGSSTPRI